MAYIKELDHCIKKFFELNTNLNKTPSNLKDIYDVFNEIYSKAKNNDAYALKILNYIQYNLCEESKIKRKVTARDFEDLVATLMNGKVLDDTKRQNKKTTTDNSTTSKFDSYIASNYREKADIEFDNGYKISIKTLLVITKEINCGSFAREALFEGVLDKYGGERKGGLGSRGQFYNTLMKIQADSIEKFKLNFSTMVNNIYKEDIIFFIKDNDFLDIYFLSGDEFRKLLISSLVNFDTLFSTIIRYEGNSFRIDRDIFLSQCINSKNSYCISISFKETNHAIFTTINNELEKINNLLLDCLYSNNLDISKCDFNSLYILDNIKDKLSISTFSNDSHSPLHSRLISLYNNNFFKPGPVIFHDGKDDLELLFTTSIYEKSNKLEFKLFKSDKLLFSSEYIEGLSFDRNIKFSLSEIEVKKKVNYQILEPDNNNFKILVFGNTSSKYKSIIQYNNNLYILKKDDCIHNIDGSILLDEPIKYEYRKGCSLYYKEINTNTEIKYKL